jgi:hypothetical protein
MDFLEQFLIKKQVLNTIFEYVSGLRVLIVVHVYPRLFEVTIFIGLLSD